MPVSRKRRFCLAWPYNKSFIDRASPVKMLNISLVFFWRFYGCQLFVAKNFGNMIQPS